MVEKQSTAVGKFNLLLELERDHSYINGQILSSMNCHADFDAREVFIENLESNLGDPALFPGTVNIEAHVIRVLGQLFNLPDTGTGLILTGGSEANITALWAIRNNERKRENHSESGPLEIIAPRSAHISINKAANLLNLKLISIPVDNKYKIDIRKARQAINTQTIGIVGVAGTTAFGTIDPLWELNEICLENEIPLHIDAAFGGMVFPFLPNSEEYNLSFKLRSLISMTVDLHKMGRVPIPGGGLLWRDKKYSQAVEFTLPYLAGHPKQYTFTGTRSGASSIAFAYLWEKIGKEGFESEVIRCIQNTVFLARELKHRGFTIPIDPLINILGVQIPDSLVLSQEEFHKALWEHGWITSLVNGVLRFVIMPATSRSHILSLLDVIDQLMTTST
ncbi:MAG: tyrosine decarboxylase MfnA [Candidatus Hodarchaeales archaeon]|jgi:tyrosine decarboxylase/aspartate 1-decarboxylase